MAPIESSSITVSRGGVASPDGRGAGKTVVSLRGQHDAFTASTFSDAMDWAMALDDGDLVVDLSAVDFMGVAVAGAILRAQELLRSQSRSLVLRSPSRCAQRLLDLCGLARLVDLRPVDAALPAGPAGALGTWVAVPASERVDRLPREPSPEPRHTKVRAAEPESSMADHGRP